MSNNRSEALWQNYDICTTKEKIIESAKRDHGGFVCTDGAWCMTRTTKEFADMLEYFFGFQIEKDLKDMEKKSMITEDCTINIYSVRI